MNIRPNLFVQLSWPSMGPLAKRRDIQLDVDVEALDLDLHRALGRPARVLTHDVRMYGYLTTYGEGEINV